MGRAVEMVDEVEVGDEGGESSSLDGTGGGRSRPDGMSSEIIPTLFSILSSCEDILDCWPWRA